MVFFDLNKIVGKNDIKSDSVTELQGWMFYMLKLCTNWNKGNGIHANNSSILYWDGTCIERLLGTKISSLLCL